MMIVILQHDNHHGQPDSSGVAHTGFGIPGDPMTREPRHAPTRFHQLMEPWVADCPDAPAQRDAHAAPSYRALHDASVASEVYLKSLGVRPGDRLLVVGENCAALCVLVLAASRMEAWVVVANARLSEREIDLFVAHARPRQVLYTPHVSPEAARHAERRGAQIHAWPGRAQIPISALNGTTVPEPCFEDPRAQVVCVL